MADWDTRFMRLAQHIAAWSKDRSRRVGAIIVGPDRELRAAGFNGFPKRVDDGREERYARPAKYRWTEHAERNAIYYAARNGVALNGCTMYLPWFPCMDCARAIVQAGIVRLVCQKPDLEDPQWGTDFAEVPQLLKEASVEVTWWLETESASDSSR